MPEVRTPTAPTLDGGGRKDLAALSQVRGDATAQAEGKEVKKREIKKDLLRTCAGLLRNYRDAGALLEDFPEASDADMEKVDAVIEELASEFERRGAE